MIRRKEDVRIRKVDNAMGGEGHVCFHDWLLPEEAPGHGRVFSKVVIPQGSSIGMHTHQGEFEAFTVIAGQGQYYDGDAAPVAINVGDMTLCKNGEKHSVANVCEEDLVLMALIMNDLA